MSVLKTFTISIKELKDTIIFLRKLIPGGSEHSFGIHVAKMAGMPTSVIHRANKMLKKLEQSHSSDDIKDKLKQATHEETQLSFFQTR